MCASCPQLKTVRLPEGAERIGREVFTGCMSLADVYLPESLTDIADDAFPGDCAAIFYIAKGSEAAKWCSEHGSVFEAV